MINNHYICNEKFYLTFKLKIYSVFTWGQRCVRKTARWENLQGSKEGLSSVDIWGNISYSSIDSIRIDDRDVYRLQVAIYTCGRFLFSA
jgi:hypothetical protein